MGKILKFLALLCGIPLQLTSSFHGYAQPLQGSFPRVCNLLREYKQEIAHTADIHDNNKRLFIKNSDLWKYLDDLPKVLGRDMERTVYKDLPEKFAIRSLLGKVKYIERAQACKDAGGELSKELLRLVDFYFAKLILDEHEILNKRILNITELQEKLIDDIKPIMNKLSVYTEKLYLKTTNGIGNSESIFEPCKTLEAALDVFFRTEIPETVFKFNRYDNSKTFIPFWGGLERYQKPQLGQTKLDFLIETRYKIWLAMGAAWTAENVIDLMYQKTRLLNILLRRITWETQLFKYKSRYEGFICDL